MPKLVNHTKKTEPLRAHNKSVQSMQKNKKKKGKEHQQTQNTYTVPAMLKSRISCKTSSTLWSSSPCAY